MKIIYILLLTISILIAKDEITIGGGAYLQSQPYSNLKDKLLPSPVIFFDYSIFYIRWSKFGVYFLGEKNDRYGWGLSLVAQPRIYGYIASDSNSLIGMSNKKTSWESGIDFSASYLKNYIEISLLTDAINQHDNWILQTEIGTTYKLNKLTIYPSIIATYQSQNFLNYYYGVNNHESNILHPYYKASDGFEIGMQTYASYSINKYYLIFLNLKYTKLPKTAQDSPIVSDNYLYSGLFSLLYKFSY